MSKCASKKIDGWLFIIDAFGPIPVWSLQEPVKGAADSFLVHPAMLFKKKKPNGWASWPKSKATGAGY